MNRLTPYALCTLAALAGGPVALGGGTPLATLRVAAGLNRPVLATHAPSDYTRLFIVEQRGVIKILNMKTGIINPATFLNIDALVAGPSSSNDERGLLGLAFHPDYQTNGFFYVYYTNNLSDTVVARYTRSTPDAADAASALIILTVDQPQTNHNGGWIDFGPNDGYLYIATGDGGASCDNGSGHTSGTGNSQDITDNLLGKMLRIDVDGGSPYAIPPDNPFVGVTGDDEIWAYGLRNAWRNAFDRANGDLFIADVGQNAFEELDYQKSSSQGGENYGWRCMEGTSCSSASGCSTTGCACGSPALSDPFQTYSHTCTTGGFSITGGYVYRGCAIPDLVGTYFYADFVCGNFWSLRYDGDAVTEFQSRDTEFGVSQGGFLVNQISSFGEDARGEIYIVDRGGTTTGQVFRIVPDTYTVPFSELTCDLNVDSFDLAILLGEWGTCDGCISDLDGNGTVSGFDLPFILGDWGPLVP